MKRYTDKKAAKVFNNVLNVIRIENNKMNTFYNPWTTGNNTYVCNGFSMYQIEGQIPEGTKLVEETAAQTEYYKHTRDKIVNDIFYPAINNKNNVQIETITSEYIKQNRNSKNLVTLPGKDMPYFNSKYLSDMVTLFPNGKYYINQNKGKISPITVIDENGFGLLLPVRVF